jgi:predicted metal-dependent phosphoesterase TrpH
METRTKVRPLLCELHAHTTWSDGSLSVPELVDLYGRRGFDVLCVTDHILADDDPWLGEQSDAAVPALLDERSWPAYLDEIEREAARARERYGLVVIPGAELTLNHENPDRAAHAVAVGLRSFVSLDDGIEGALRAARAFGAGLIAAHPHGGHDPDPIPFRTTRRFWRERALLGPLVDRFELFNRHDLFGWVAEAGVPVVANGDFHRVEHVATWKTLLPCAKEEHAVLTYLRSSRPAYLTRLDDEPKTATLAAA